ncbi:MAG: Jag N-terminal domain-containing protein [Eubacterium sp.]
MIKEFIGTGKTVEEATQNAKLQLNAPEMADVHVEVIKYPEKKKFFGLIGGCDAEVKVSYDDGKREKKADAPKKSYEKKANSPKKPAPKKQEVKRSQFKLQRQINRKKRLARKTLTLTMLANILRQ